MTKTEAEPMVHWIRTFWRDDLESITEINGKAVYPSKKDALEAAIHRAYVEEVPEPYSISLDYDIVDAVNAIHVGWYTNVDGLARHSSVPAYKYQAVRSVLAEREAELLELKGPCSTKTCPLHYAHRGPCECPTDTEMLADARTEKNKS